MVYLISALLILTVLLIAAFTINGEEEREPVPSTAGEEFISTWLTNENETLATYIQRGDVVDEDLVKGRESLTETLGLWMIYALEKEDKPLFDQSYQQLEDYFLEADGFLNWKVTEEGESEVAANALIDDIRLSGVLVEAYEKWNDESYMETARTINNYLNEHNINEGIFTDFYEKEDEYVSDAITLSYIDGEMMDLLAQRGGLDQEAVVNTKEVLKEAPIHNGFYPKSYDVETNEYQFDEEINIVDQAILSFHFAKMGNRSEEFLQFIRGEMEERGVVHGMYNRETKSPLVDYESPAVYAYLILYSLEINEDALAEKIYERMKEFQVSDQKSDYYGGYGISDDDTHIFDNVNPMIAEQRMENNS